MIPANTSKRGHQLMIKSLKEKETILKEKTRSIQPRATKAREGIR
jgi:hypothetical protein